MVRKKIIIIASTFLFILFSSCLAFSYWQKNLPLVSPLDLVENLSPINNILKKKSEKVIFGFMPYWNLRQANQLRVKELTHLAYFGIDLNPDGTVKQFLNKRETEPGFNKLNSHELSLLMRQIKILNKKNILVIRAMDNDLIESIVNSKNHSKISIDNIIRILTQFHFDGLNIDFEYIGSPNQITKDNFSSYVSDLSSACKISLPNCEMSIDILADTGVKNRIHNLSAISKSLDHIIIMAYDYYRSSSTIAGPVAPLRGKCDNKTTSPCLEYDVVSSVSDISRQVPTKKLILGIPFYGYEWQVASPNFLANTYPKSGGIATYKRIQSLISDPPNPENFANTWSEVTKSPYIVYEERGQLFQIHYENTLSLKLKLDLVNQSILGGIGIWALGYETPNTDLWDTIDRFL